MDFNLNNLQGFICHKTQTNEQFQVESYQRLKKWYLTPPCLILSILRYRSMIIGAIQEKELCILLHVCKVSIEKEAFGSPSTTIG